VDYFNRTGTARSNIYDNKVDETRYYYSDHDSNGKQLNGRASYEVTFAPGQEPPVDGFFSLGTKNKTLKRSAAGSLTIYVGSRAPGKTREMNWLPAPKGDFSLYIRAYWGKPSILDGSWQPPAIRKVR
jgi:hypothetical protein